MPAMTVRNRWLWVAILLTVAKLWLTGGQTVFAIGQALHDDHLFAALAGHIVNGEWLGPYNEFTLAKGPLYSVFIALNFWIGLPLLLSQQILYAVACATITWALAPWLRRASLKCGFYLLLLWNPMSFDAGNLSRLMRQNLYTPLALFTIAGLIMLFTRRRAGWRSLLGPSLLAGLSLGCFWITREESVWLLPAVGLLWFGLIASLGRELCRYWSTLSFSFGLFTLTALLPLFIVSTLNWQHYGWFGTVEFRATEFKAAYGALTRPLVGPELDQVPVTRQMREALYKVSPSFAKLQPLLDGPIADHWSDKIHFPATDRQMRGGWFIWALRDAVAQSKLAPDAAAAMHYYQSVADEVNAACDEGLIPARPHRSGFLPPLSPNLVSPIYETALDFIKFFGSFSGFTAVSPDSLGDYADLKPFRDLVGTPLSYAPRSPQPVVATQAKWRARKVSLLESIGLRTASVLCWIGPFIILIGLVRVLECAIDRHVTYLLGLAGALLSVCLAYLAINTLIQVTSFFNQSPAALAAAYPLYLTALAAIAVDAWQTWRRPAEAANASVITEPRSTRFVWLAPWGIALLVFAAHLAEIHAFGSDVAHNDQWLVEGKQIIEPWLAGNLSMGDFFQSHLGQIPVWTRLLAWLQVVFTGRWDPLVQMTVNAALYAGFVGLIARWIVREFRPVTAVITVGLLIFGGSLPHAWENTTWGYQSSVPLALIFLFLHVHGSLTRPRWSPGWWLAQGAALAGLFTLSLMWLAPLAVVVASLWIGSRRMRDHAVPLGISALGLILMICNRAAIPGSGLLSALANSPFALLHACLQPLGWPSSIPGAVAIIQLPWCIHALRLRNQEHTSGFDRIILTFGLWNIGVAITLALSRGVNDSGFLSQEGDLLLIGTLVGALALFRLVPRSGHLRSLFLTLAVIWSGLVVSGLVINSTDHQAQFFHDTSSQNAEARRATLQTYLEHHDRALIDQDSSRWLLYEDADLITELLDQPQFQTLLPSSVYSPNPQDALGSLARLLQSKWIWVAGLGIVMLLPGLILLFRQQAGFDHVSPLNAPVDPWRWRVATIIAIGAGVMMFAWSNPLSFNREYRWQQTLGGDQALSSLAFKIVGPSVFDSSRLRGAAPITPEVLRNQFYGTAPEGPELTCAVLSSAFEITKPWLVVPYAGYPIGNGNGLRLRVLDQDGREHVDEIGCPGPNSEGVAYWTVDVHALQGRQVQLVLYDGRTGTEGWVAAAAPVPTDDPKFAESLAGRLQREGHIASHAALGAIALIALLCALVSRFSYRRQ